MALQGLTGLSAIAGQQTLIDEQSQATPEEKHGGPADPFHAFVGEQATPYPWQSKMGQAAQAGPHGGYESGLLGDPEWAWEDAGLDTEDPYMDLTPSRRAAPWPKGILSGPIAGDTPDAIANQLQQSAVIHATNHGASRRMIHTPNGDVQQDQWERIDELNPGFSALQPQSRQAMSSSFMFGNRDRTTSFARQNEYGFDSAHMMRRYAVGSVPGNYMWMRPGGRPMRKSLAGPARPAIGPQSPFAGDDLGYTFGIDGAMLQNVPTEYTPPPQPTLAASNVSDSYSDTVEWY
jgi:hypothetical protein